MSWRTLSDIHHPLWVKPPSSKMAMPWSVLGLVLVTWCLLPVCAGIFKVPNEHDGTDDVLFDSMEVLTINKLPALLKQLTEVQERRWLRQYNKEYELYINQEAIANWNYATNITDENARKTENTARAIMEWTEKQQAEARRYYYHFKRCESGLAPCKPRNITYALRVIVNTQSSTAPKDSKLRDELLHISTQLEGIYSKASLAKPGKTPLKLEPGLTQLMAKSQDYDELLWAWVGWRNQTGKKMRTLYDRFVKLQNIGASDIGLADTGTQWRVANYDMDEDLETMVDSLFNHVAPLYKELHAYVRRKLIEKYPGRGISATGPIPAHLLGNMWAQQWDNIYDLVLPFPDVAPIDVTATMLAQNYTPTRMFQTAEAFYMSIGLDPMTKTFWNKSMLTRPNDPGREVVCHASAEDFFLGDDYRIKMCTKVNQADLTTIHHEMGHIEYFMQYRKQDPIFRSGANAAFHEAIGDTIALSVMTPGHLQKIKLLTPKNDNAKNKEDEDKREINFLLKMALEKIAFLPFGYLIDKYRWEVFRGTINISNYNQKWWEYRLKYQGIQAPVNRSEADFDPGAKYHVAANVPYMRYFLSFIGQFQFHKALCGLTGESGKSDKKLHECDIYKSKAAGARLKETLSLGASKPWPDVMEVLTGQRDFTASAIGEYFQPLITWLQKQNKDEKVGWKGQHMANGGREPKVSEWLQEKGGIINEAGSEARSGSDGTGNTETEVKQLLRALILASEEEEEEEEGYSEQ